jgi:hypothetical protein
MTTVTRRHRTFTPEELERFGAIAKSVSLAMEVNIKPMLKAVENMKLNLPDISGLTALSEQMQNSMPSIEPILKDIERMKANLPDTSHITALSKQVRESMPNMELINQTMKTFHSLPKMTFPELPSTYFEHRVSSYEERTIFSTPSRREQPVVHQHITVNVHIQGNTIISRNFLQPKVSRWEEISLKFLNSHEVEISDGKNKQKSTFYDLGFMSQTTNSPKVTWTLLEKFASNRGTLSKLAKDGHANFKQELSMLREDLQRCFGITEDPFENTRNGKCKIKIDIIGS